MRVYVPGEGPISLRAADFVARGGQGSVYARGDTAYKVFDDPLAAPPAGKVAELGCVTDPHLIRPDQVLLDSDGAPVGYTMRYLRDAWPLCRLFTRTFRERYGVLPATRVRLVARMARTVAALHAAGVTVVDLNELNVLVSPAFDAAFFIDADSYQTPSYPATAVAEGIVDRHATPGVFDAKTDWFAFAVTTFQLLVGVHPYRGVHPEAKGLDARMRGNLSVFDPRVRVPPSAEPFSDIPPRLRAWYEAVFELGERRPPPLDLDVPAPPPLPPGEVLVTPRHGLRIQLRREPDGVRLFDLDAATAIPTTTRADDAVVYANRLYLRSGENLLELRLHDAGPRILPVARVVGRVHRHATQLFPGAAIQSLLGATFVSRFVAPGRCPQTRVPELDGYRVVDARADHDALRVLAERGGVYDRLTLRFHGASACRVDVEPDVGLR